MVRTQGGKDMKKRTQLALLAMAAAAAWLGLEVAKIPRPSDEDMDYDTGLAIEEWDFVTEDGAVLKGKRYVNEGAQPAILAHGFLGNGYEFDLPRRDRNLAVHLARFGWGTAWAAWSSICTCRGPPSRR
jgi:hypothetical protein